MLLQVVEKGAQVTVCLTNSEIKNLNLTYDLILKRWDFSSRKDQDCFKSMVSMLLMNLFRFETDLSDYQFTIQPSKEKVHGSEKDFYAAEAVIVKRKVALISSAIKHLYLASETEERDFSYRFKDKLFRTTVSGELYTAKETLSGRKKRREEEIAHLKEARVACFTVSSMKDMEELIKTLKSGKVYHTQSGEYCVSYRLSLAETEKELVLMINLASEFFAKVEFTRNDPVVDETISYVGSIEELLFVFR